MTYYYETAPLPTWLAWYAHHLPVWWHHFESRATLVLELVVPFGIFGPRRGAPVRARPRSRCSRSCNAATANYGFFCYLAVALARLPARRRRRRARARAPRAARVRAGGVRRAAARLPRSAAPARVRPRASSRARTWAGRSRGAALFVARVARRRARSSFAEPGPALSSWRRCSSSTSGSAWSTPTTCSRRSRASASSPNSRRWPTAPSTDARPTTPPGRRTTSATSRATSRARPTSWRRTSRASTSGSGSTASRFQRREPAYVPTLLERMCEDPAAVQPLFRAPLPAAPRRRAHRLLAVSVRQPPPRGAPPAPGGDGRASRRCVRYPVLRLTTR